MQILHTIKLHRKLLKWRKTITNSAGHPKCSQFGIATTHLKWLPNIVHLFVWERPEFETLLCALRRNHWCGKYDSVEVFTSGSSSNIIFRFSFHILSLTAKVTCDKNNNIFKWENLHNQLDHSLTLSCPLFIDFYCDYYLLFCRWLCFI